MMMAGTWQMPRTFVCNQKGTWKSLVLVLPNQGNILQYRNKYIQKHTCFWYIIMDATVFRSLSPILNLLIIFGGKTLLT